MGKRNDSFAVRLDRIARREGVISGRTLVGPEATTPIPPRPRIAVGTAARRLLMLPPAVAVGAAALMLGQLTSYHLFSGDGLYAFRLAGMGSEMLADVVVALMLAFAAAMVLGLSGGLARYAMLTGAVLAMATEPAMVAQAPDLFAVMFSPDWVAETLARGPIFL